MARDWVLVPSLVTLREEFNELAPARDKTSDGSIGNRAHAAGGNSDHLPDEEFDALRDHDADSKNEVHAIDVDSDLRLPGVSMEEAVQFLLTRCRAGAEKRLRYIIYNRRIWSASSGWKQKAYTGSNPHDHHAHFSASYDPGREADTRPYELEDLMPVDYDKIRTIVREEVDKRIDALKVPADAPTAEAVAEAVWKRVRNDPKNLLSDTAVNLTEARITEAIVDGVAIERYPANEGK